mmetsp:Transcript_62149/g.166762  ORF Transcript_62149/g.166762 Transcript_62149/m.166762 type:complete len:201 (+) Transcript_62149:630-1232(+)
MSSRLTDVPISWPRLSVDKCICSTRASGWDAGFPWGRSDGSNSSWWGWLSSGELCSRGNCSSSPRGSPGGRCSGEESTSAPPTSSADGGKKRSFSDGPSEPELCRRAVSESIGLVSRLMTAAPASNPWRSPTPTWTSNRGVISTPPEARNARPSQLPSPSRPALRLTKSPGDSNSYLTIVGTGSTGSRSMTAYRPLVAGE